MNNLAKKYNIIFMRQCRVCGDKASAFNFDGLSCESCKSFFRRNAFRENELECHKKGMCEITLETRKFCAKCRLSRCFEIGMKKELIFKRKFLIATEEQELTRIKFEVLNSFYTPANPLVMDLMNKSPYPSLTSYEKTKIEEVVAYYQFFKEENTFEKIIHDADRETCMEFCEDYGITVIKTMKSIPTVKNYSIDDKMIMVRNFVAIFMDLRYAFYYDIESYLGTLQFFKRGDTVLKASVIAVWGDLLPEDVKKTWKENLARNKFAMMNDTIIRDLLITIGLFRESDKISCPQVLRNHYLEYYYLLRRYLQTKLKNRERFEKQMKLFHDVLDSYPKIEDVSKQFFHNVSPHHPTEMMSEIYLNL